jgi:hypothetical protein
MRAPRDLTGLIKFLARDDWKSRLENRSRQQPDPANPMAIYDFAWLWRELKVEHLRR